MKDTKFMRLLKARPDQRGRRMTVKKLAALAGMNRSHVTKILAGQAAYLPTRWRLMQWLTTEEIQALGWEAELPRELAMAEAAAKTIRFHMEHCGRKEQIFSEGLDCDDEPVPAPEEIMGTEWVERMERKR